MTIQVIEPIAKSGYAAFVKAAAEWSAKTGDPVHLADWHHLTTPEREGFIAATRQVIAEAAVAHYP